MSVNKNAKVVYLPVHEAIRRRLPRRDVGAAGLTDFDSSAEATRPSKAPLDRALESSSVARRSYLVINGTSPCWEQ